MKQLTNEQVLELFNTLNALKPKKGSQQEMAQVKTLRRLKEWSTKFNEEVGDIRDQNCAFDKDTKVLIKDTVKVSAKTEKGEEETKEEKINTYTPEGQAKMKKDLREFYKKTVGFNLEVVPTVDDTDINGYQKEVLIEYGFLITQEEWDKAVAEKQGKKPTDETTEITDKDGEQP